MDHLCDEGTRKRAHYDNIDGFYYNIDQFFTLQRSLQKILNIFLRMNDVFIVMNTLIQERDSIFGTNWFKHIKSSINFLLVLKYISFDFCQLRQNFQHKGNFSLPDNIKNKFYTSIKVKISIYDILVFPLL